MFTRNATVEPKKLEPLKNSTGPNLSAPQQAPPPRRASASEVGAKSVIGNDLKIIGQGHKIISQGTTQASFVESPSRCRPPRAWREISTTCRLPSNRGQSSTVAAAGPPTRPN